MARIADRFRLQTLPGQPVEYGEMVVTPVSTAISVDLPHFGFAWNWPASVLIQEGETKREIPIVNITRMTQFALYGIGLAVVAMMWMFSRFDRR